MGERRHELMESERQAIADLFPAAKPAGRPVRSTREVDPRGTPLGFTLTAGQVHECTQFEALKASAGLAGRPDRRRPGRVAGDRIYRGARIPTWRRTR